MGTIDRLDPAQLRGVIATFRDALRAHQQPINRLNVYPVPDGDTGTNMALTLESVVTELESADPDLEPTCKAISHGSLMGARGNSGVILSQILRGIAEVVRDDPACDAATWAKALANASELAYGAVMKPVEGTILTVVRESSESADKALADGGALVDVLDAARVGGGEALARTPELLPVLAEAGVVDAGGSGYLLLLDALLYVVDERPLPEPSDDDGIIEPRVGVAAGLDGLHAQADHDVSDLRYEVMYFLEAPDDTIPAFKDVWAGIGDSIVVVGGDGLWNCHIHTDDIGASIEAAIDIGRPRSIRVTDLIEQVEEERWVREAEADDDVPERLLEPVPTAVVAVATGDGVKRIFHSLGVQGIVAGGQSMNPSTAQLLAAVEQSPGESVVILPNNKNIVPVAEQVDDQTEKTVVVVPTHNITEGFASLLAYDPQASAADNGSAMVDASAHVVTGEITRAVRESSCDKGPIADGDYIGIGPVGIVAVADSVAEACTELLSELVADEHEIVTIIEGDGASAAFTRHITEWLADNRPDVDAEIHHGGQPLYPYLFGIE
jgi:DAK2 domain fusion protein YloV